MFSYVLVLFCGAAIEGPSRRVSSTVKRSLTQDFLLRVFFQESVPWAPESAMGAISNSSGNSRRYSKVKR